MLDIDLGVNLSDLMNQNLLDNKNRIYKTIIKSNQYPNDKITLYPLKKGDSIFLSNRGMNKTYLIGDKIKYHNDYWIVSEVYTKKRNWRNFWKKAEVLGYKIDFSEEGDNN